MLNINDDHYIQYRSKIQVIAHVQLVKVIENTNVSEISPTFSTLRLENCRAYNNVNSTFNDNGESFKNTLVVISPKAAYKLYKLIYYYIHASNINFQYFIIRLKKSYSLSYLHPSTIVLVFIAASDW